VFAEVLVCGNAACRLTVVADMAAPSAQQGGKQLNSGVEQLQQPRVFKEIGEPL